MRPHLVCRIAAAALSAIVLPLAFAQETRPAPADTKDAGSNRISVDAKLVVVPAVVYDKKGLVTTLTQSDFAITVDGKSQTIRYFDRDTDVPLTVGLLVDVSRSQTTVLDEEQKASQKFLESFLQSASGTRLADKAFVLQFAHTAELLQDVTDSRPLLEAGLKEIGTQAPGSAEDTDQSQQGSDGNSSPGSTGSANPGNNGGYGRRGGYPGGGSGGRSGGSRHDDQARGGTVLYDSVFLASNDVLAKQKGRRALIVLTDGVDRHSKESLVEAIEAAQRADTVVYALYYKGQEHGDFMGPRRSYGGYDPYGRYPPTTGGSTDPGTYRDPDGKKILDRICSETGGRMFELKGKGAIDGIYKQIGDELRAQYRLGFTPGYEAASAGFHPILLTLTNPADKKFEIQTRVGYYTGQPKNQ